MKSLVIFLSCVGLTVAVVNAEPEKEGKAKRAAQARQAQQLQGPGGGKHGKRSEVFHGTAQRNAETGSVGKTARHTQHRFSTAEQGNVPRVKSEGKLRAGGGKAQIKHFDLANSRNPQIQSVKFKANNRIIGAEKWTGARYTVFRSYRAAWHDRVWWTAHYPRIVLIGGGWYYWNAGFWFPAWGYDPGAAYYPYDGPIYGYNDLPPDQVVANVQQELEDQGYYHGEVDGMLGPLTRAALADYQRDHGLYTTAAIDEPTMSSLGFS